MMKHRIVGCIALAAVLAVAAASAHACGSKANEVEGVWTPGPVLTVPAMPSFCARDYSCGPKQTIMTDAKCKIVATEKVRVSGACSAGGGAVDSCNHCLTNEPSKPCMWHTEER